MSALSTSTVSKAFESVLAGRKLRSAVFTTFQFDPGFFEQEILPVFLDVPLSHAEKIRTVQIEEALRAVPGQVSVYYDANGLVSGGDVSAKQDIRRIPVRMKKGIFHPKNVFALVENPAAEDEIVGHSLLVGTLSANLTRSGWWENLEVAQVEELAPEAPSRMAEGLVTFLRRLRVIGFGADHAAIDEILEFLRKVPRRKQRSNQGRLYAYFHAGTESVADMVESAAGDSLRGMSLEVIAPYFDDADSCGPLVELVKRFKPQEVRLLLPRDRSGAVACSARMYDAVVALSGKTTVSWGTLPKDLLRLGTGSALAERFVHAKVYRFFSKKPGREVLVCGSINMTTAAHARINQESAVVVEINVRGRPEFWLEPVTKRPVHFDPKNEVDDAIATRGSRLQLRYDWSSRRAEVLWDNKTDSPVLSLHARGQFVAKLDPIEPSGWHPVPDATSAAIAAHLESTSLFEVQGEEGGPLLILAQEDGMADKPSLLFQLSPADILKYWSLLTTQQRAAFIETHGLMDQGSGDPEFAPLIRKVLVENDLFEAFAGIFHAFGALQRSVSQALDQKRVKEAHYRIFGKKYDSLGSLLQRLAHQLAERDHVNDYLILLCAKQLCEDLRHRFNEFWESHALQSDLLEDVDTQLQQSRKMLLERNDGAFKAFIDWFEPHFLTLAKPRGSE